MPAMPVLSTSSLDPVNVAIAVAAVIFGPALSGFIGPYAVILLGATVGASWSLGRRIPSTGRFSAVWFFVRINVTASLLTVSLANFAGHWLGTTDHNWLLTVVSMFVGGVGDDWPRLGAWLVRRGARGFEKVTGTQSKRGDLE